MPQEIADALARLGELTDTELAKLQGDIVKEFDKIDKAKVKSADQVELMEALVAAHETVIGEQTQREASAAEQEERAATLRSKLHPADGADPADGEDEGEGDGTPSSELPAEPTGDAPVLPVAAAAKLPTLAELAASKAPAAKRGRPAPVRVNARTVAQFQSSRQPIKMGDRITSRDEFYELFTEKVNALVSHKGTGEKHVVASIFTEYPDDRKLGPDADANEKKLRAVTSREAITASGGVCGPVAVDYDILVLSSQDEPLGDSLPKFNGDRGGVRYIVPPSFSSVGSSATAVWTEATDLAPGGATKPVQTVQCASVVETYVNAIATRLKFGNMQGRFFPELIAANTELALANAARVKELSRLATISANSTIVSSGQLLGASRDALATLDLASAALRYRSRLDRTVNLRAVFPDWAKDMFRADLTRELAHGQDTAFNSLSLSDADVTALLSDRGVNVTWMLDGQAAVTAAPTSALQGFAAQTANQTLNDWPHTLVWWLYPEGTFQLIDGGQMDFGVIRDSVLDATNDYETMIEVFENVIFRGFESLQVVSAVRPNGASAAGITTATSPNLY